MRPISLSAAAAAAYDSHQTELNYMYTAALMMITADIDQQATDLRTANSKALKLTSHLTQIRVSYKLVWTEFASCYGLVRVDGGVTNDPANPISSNDQEAILCHWHYITDMHCSPYRVQKI